MMMTTTCRFAYVQARIQARYAGLPTDPEWQRLSASRGLAGFLEEARTGVLRDWVKAFSGQSEIHDIEAGLRARYREQVAEVAGWVPQPWRGSVVWTHWLVLLPLFDHLANGGEMPSWVARDQGLNALLDAAGGLDPSRLQDHRARLFLRPCREPASVWLQEWRGRWPSCKREFLRNLDDLQALITKHLDVFRRSRPEAGWDQRRALRVRLRFLFHRRLLQPAAPFIYLALSALDLERLRAELVDRALFAARGAS